MEQLPLFSQQQLREIEEAQQELAWFRYFESLLSLSYYRCRSCHWELSPRLQPPLSKGVVFLIFRGMCAMCFWREWDLNLKEEEGSETKPAPL